MKISTGLLSFRFLLRASIFYAFIGRVLVEKLFLSFFLFIFFFFKSEEAKVAKFETLETQLFELRSFARELMPSYASESLARLFASRADITFNGPLIQF